MTLETKGLVLRSVKYGESDKLITVLTEEGKIFFKARGIRSITSKNAAACATFVYSEFVLQRRGDKMFLMKARPLYSTLRAGASLSSLALASYLANLAEDTALDAETGKTVLPLLMNALYLISKEDRPTDLIKAIFEMRLLAANGLMPRLEECAECEKEVQSCSALFFRLNQGDLVCSECLSSEDRELLRVSKEVLSVCRHSVESTDDKAYAIKLPESVLKSFSHLAERFLIHQLERSYQTLDFYHQIRLLDEKAPNGETNESV